MSDLIKRGDALALVEQWFATDNHLYSIILNDITNLPAIDPAAIREAALREAIAECQTVMETAKLYHIPPMAMGAAACREAILALIGEKE